MLRLVAPLAALLALAACDSGPEPEVIAMPPPIVSTPISTGTFTALLNGEPYEVPATYYATDSGWGDEYSSLWFFLDASLIDSTLYPPYVQRLHFGAPGRGFTGPEFFSLTGPARDTLFFVSESIADGVLQAFNPVEGAGGGLRVVEADSAAGRFRATFEGTFAAIGPRGRYQRLPDTLRFTDGEFVIDLATE